MQPHVALSGRATSAPTFKQMADLARFKTVSRHCPAPAHHRRKSRPTMGSNGTGASCRNGKWAKDASGHAFWSDLLLTQPKQADPVIILMPQQASTLPEPQISTNPRVARRRTGTHHRSRYTGRHATMGQGEGPGTARWKSQPATGLLWRAGQAGAGRKRAAIG